MIGTKDKSDLNDIWRTINAVSGAKSVHGFDFMYASELNGHKITLWRIV